jgi:hypothetical protein
MVRRAEVEEAQSLVEMAKRAELEKTRQWLKWLGEQRLRYQERTEPSYRQTCW